MTLLFGCDAREKVPKVSDSERQTVANYCGAQDTSTFTVADIAGVLNKQVAIGMSASAVVCIKGRPLDVNRSGSASGIREQWNYPAGEYLYFKDGMLSSWQNLR